MNIKLILIFLLLNCFLSYGQYEWTSGKLILKNGDSLVGFIRIPMNVARLVSVPLGKPKVEFKKDMLGYVSRYDKSQVNKIQFNTYDANPGYYEYAPLKKRKYRIFKSLLDGKVKLYTRTVAIEHKKRIGGNPNNPNSGVYKYNYEEEQEFYVIREGESKLTPLVSHYSLNDFNTKTIKYFLDCKKIIEYLKEDLYSEIDIIELVNDYNLLCE